MTPFQPEAIQAPHGNGPERFIKSSRAPIESPVREMAGQRKDGTGIAIEVAFSEMTTNGPRWFVGFNRDISDRKRTEKELQENREQFRVAREIQQHQFPRSAPAVAGFDLAGLSHPPGAMGVDYLDYLTMKHGRIGLVVGRVTGHGFAQSCSCLRPGPTFDYCQGIVTTSET